MRNRSFNLKDVFAQLSESRQFGFPGHSSSHSDFGLLGGSAGMPFGIPGMDMLSATSGMLNIVDSTMTICQIGEDGQVRVHTTGSIIKEVPATILSPESQAVIKRINNTIKMLDEKVKALEAKRQEYAGLKKRLDFEPTLLQDDISDLFPQYAGSSVQVCRKGVDEGFYLEVNGCEMDDEVPMDDGESFFQKQKEHAEIQKRADTLESEWKNDVAWFEAKKKMIPVLFNNLADSLLANDRETAMKLAAISPNEQGELVLLVREPVDETSNHLPEGMIEVIRGMAKMDPQMRENLPAMEALLQLEGNGRTVPELPAETGQEEEA